MWCVIVTYPRILHNIWNEILHLCQSFEFLPLDILSFKSMAYIILFYFFLSGSKPKSENCMCFFFPRKRFVAFSLETIHYFHTPLGVWKDDNWSLVMKWNLICLSFTLYSMMQALHSSSFDNFYSLVPTPTILPFLYSSKRAFLPLLLSRVDHPLPGYK